MSRTNPSSSPSVGDEARPDPGDPGGPPADGTDPTADRMLAAARQGSNRAWAALIERVDPGCRLLAHLVLDGHDVDGTLQSAYVRAYRARRKGPDDAVVVLLHHAWIACGHEVRRRQRRGAPAPGRRPQPDERPSGLGSTAEARILAGLRPEERAVWALVERADLPVDAVAAALGVGPQVITGVSERVGARLADATPVEDGPSETDGESRPPDAISGDLADDEGRERSDAVDPDPDAAEQDVTPVDPVDEATAAHEVDLDLSDDADPPDPEAPDPGEDGSLEPAPAAPEFWKELGRRLTAERDAVAAAPPPSLPDPGGPSPSLTQAKAPPVAMQKRPPRRARRRQADLVDGLADEVDRQRPRRHWPGLLVRIAAALVIIGILAAAVAALYNAASTARSPVRGDSTAEVANRSMGVMADAGTWSATIERTEAGDGGEETEATFTVQAHQDGSYLITDDSIDRTVSYAADLGVVRDVIPGFPIRNDQGVAPGGPDPSPPRAGLPIADLATTVRALSTEDDTEPEDTEVDGRKVRRLTGSIGEDIQVTYLVDDETLLPFRVTWTRGGADILELRFRDVIVGVDGVTYSQDLPPEAPPPTDRGFLPVPLGEVQARTGRTPLTPDYLPGGTEGFVFTGAYVNEAEEVASLRYASGPRQMIITTRPSPVAAGEPWADPFDRIGGSVTPETVTLDAGPFRGVPAQMVAGTTALASLWATDGETAITVAGDLSAEDLQRVAASLG